MEDVCFTAINDTVLPLTADSMPIWSGGVLYVPHTIFDTTSTGISLGTSCIYNKYNNTVSVFSLSKMILFDLNDGTCIDQNSGTKILARALLRNGKAYLPAIKVCSLFDLQPPSYMSTQYGYLVRIKNSGAALSDPQFVDAASNNLSRRLKEYQQSLVVPEPESTPTLDPEPLPPTTSVKPSEPTPEAPAVPVYLAFRCTTLEATSAIADALENSHKVGLFFFLPQDIGTQGDLIRRLIGSGHSIGILAEGGELSDTLALLEAGSTALEGVSHARTYFALLPKAQRIRATEQGWACWNSSKTTAPDPAASHYTNALNLVRGLPKNGRVYLTLDDSQITAGCIPALLQQLEVQNYILSIPRETRL